MTSRGRSSMVLAAQLAVAACTAPARADPVTVDGGIVINALHGRHEVGGGADARLDLAPLPLLELEARHRKDGLRVEGLPPVDFGYSGVDAKRTNTRLSIVNATYRREIGGGWFAGVGQTIYNQRTTYGTDGARYLYRRDGATYAIKGSEVQTSRVTGLRFEAGHTLTKGDERIEAWAAYNPSMHGAQFTIIPAGRTCVFRPYHALVCHAVIPTFDDAEVATQLDMSVRATHRVGRGEVVLGLRYVNYGAHYAEERAPLADRNVGFAPLLGYRLRL